MLECFDTRLTKLKQIDCLRLVIAGGREFSNYEILRDACLKVLLKSQWEDIEIVSGCARGADVLGERFALEQGFVVKLFPADWDRFGKAAGMIRNSEMARYGNVLIAFWDGKSNGTKNMIAEAKQHGCVVFVINYKGEEIVC